MGEKRCLRTFVRLGTYASAPLRCQRKKKSMRQSSRHSRSSAFSQGPFIFNLGHGAVPLPFPPGVPLGDVAAKDDDCICSIEKMVHIAMPKWTLAMRGA